MGAILFVGFLVAWSVAWFWLTASAGRDRLDAILPGAILDGFREAKWRKEIKRAAQERP